MAFYNTKHYAEKGDKRYNYDAHKEVENDADLIKFRIPQRFVLANENQASKEKRKKSDFSLSAHRRCVPPQEGLRRHQERIVS